MRVFLGIDGGGTGCRARITDSNGRLLGEGAGGSANLTLGLDVALAEIQAATRAALAAAGLEALPPDAIHAGFGLAGANVLGLAEGIRRAPLGFASLAVESDAHIACLGAHGGGDGGILILGTGSQGFVLCEGSARTIGGWGFALSDDASGAILGRAALRKALLAHDGLVPVTPLARVLLAHFDDDPAKAVMWAGSARPRDYAAFAPSVFEHAASGDALARNLVDEACTAVAAMVDRLVALGAAHVVLMGGLAPVYRPLLPARLDSMLTEPIGDALDGALMLARRAAGKDGS